MTSPTSPRPDFEVRPGASRWLAAVLAGLCVLGALLLVSLHGFAAGWGAASLLLALAVLAWWLYWYPRVVVRDEEVQVVNPFSTVLIPFNAIIDVTTKYHLTLVTPGAKYGAWAAPAPGATQAIRAARRSDRELMHDEGGSPLADRLVRVGDQTDTVSGRAAQVIRERLARLVDEGRIDPDLTETTRVMRRVNWLHPLLLVILVVLGFVLR